MNGCFPDSACPVSCFSPNETCREFSCQCAIGYSKNNSTLLCMKEQKPTLLTACDSSPCFHDGKCMVTADGYSCQCKAGYIGKLAMLLYFSVAFAPIYACISGMYFCMLSRSLIPFMTIVFDMVRKTES